MSVVDFVTNFFKDDLENHINKMIFMMNMYIGQNFVCGPINEYIIDKSNGSNSQAIAR